MKKAVLLILALALCTAILVAYAQGNNAIDSPQNSVAPGENDDISGALPEAMEKKEIKLESIKSVELLDLGGQTVDRKFSAGDIAGIVKAYNAAAIDDAFYIEMLAGNRMVITFNDGTALHISSYGSESRIVASGEDASYHLICPEIAKILLEK